MASSNVIYLPKYWGKENTHRKVHRKITTRISQLQAPEISFENRYKLLMQIIPEEFAFTPKCDTICAPLILIFHFL